MIGRYESLQSWVKLTLFAKDIGTRSFGGRNSKTDTRQSNGSLSAIFFIRYNVSTPTVSKM